MTSKKDEGKHVETLPEIIKDPSSQKTYIRGRFLGKGGFARCYELTDSDTKEMYAGKIVPKSLLVKPHQKEKMSQEISIHRSLNHKHIVGFHGFFDDAENVYILLELCRRRSLMELHKRRRTVTEPEARYLVHQIVLACDHLHQNNIIHRDLKLGNLFLNDGMEIKIGDFGLATRVDFAGERKKTLCGTPNYIAPEVLGKKGHSYEVDAWSLGCILYTLLLGKPPFETNNLKDTYARIKKNEYHIPPGRTTLQAKNLIEKLLQPEPSDRPSMHQVLQDEFFVSGFLPNGLPTSCLSTAPRFDLLRTELTRRPLCELNGEPSNAENGLLSNQKERDMVISEDAKLAKRAPTEESADCYLSELVQILGSVLKSSNYSKLEKDDDETEDPAAVPIFWVSKWVDYSDKYGLGYQLCDNSIGVLFNDSSRVILASNGENMQYIEKDGSEYFYNLKSFPESLTKKVTLLKYFKNYMSEHLLKAGSNIAPREVEEMTRLPFLRTWFRTRSAIVLHLSNGTLQINFFQDHAKIILCPLMAAITYIDEKRSARTFKLPLIEQIGCSRDLASRIRYAKGMADKLSATAATRASR